MPADNGVNGGANPQISSGYEAIDPATASKTQKKYQEERNKRLRPDGLTQYINLGDTDDPSYMRFQKDPWDDGTTASLTLKDNDHFKFLILGAGIGGLLFAVRLIEDAGFQPEDIVIVDAAAGFGGAWYWNRYPGIMCDVESYIYMPLLEETGYMPKHKYAYGEELREQANRIAWQWSLDGRAMFRTVISQCTWDDSTAGWTVEMTQRAFAGDTTTTASVRADFIMLVPGLLNRPKLPKLPGWGKFQGPSFMASRWDYKVTGGSQEAPEMSKLQDKRVGIIGTGASAVQAVPHLAQWSQELLVFQRTPASVDVRAQKATDEQEWKQNISTGPGWQMARSRNFASFLANTQPPEPVDLVSDSWTSFPSFSVLTGGAKTIGMDEIPDHVANLYQLDMPRAERIRARVDELVHDQEVAEKLKAWYPGWCKRPAFHDEYLQAFNRPNVKLVDTNGKGVKGLTETGVIANGRTYDVDVLIWSTGFEQGVLGSPGARCGVKVIGRAGLDMEDKWSKGVATFHAICTNGFPNMFFAGANQAGASPNYTPTLETFARHIAKIISASTRRIGKTQPTAKVVIEATQEAEQDWSRRVMVGAPTLAPMAGCTPSYYNAEGSLDNMSREEQMLAAPAGPWPAGLNNFMDVLEEWRSRNDELEGLHVSGVQVD
jgi:cation diffusion facilitator CzcD-associated flavoprotein CzcO